MMNCTPFPTYFQSLTLFTILSQKKSLVTQSCKILTDFCVGKYVLNCLFEYIFRPHHDKDVVALSVRKKKIVSQRTKQECNTYFSKPDPWHCKWQMMMAFPNSLKNTFVTILSQIKILQTAYIQRGEWKYLIKYIQFSSD